MIFPPDDTTHPLAQRFGAFIRHRPFPCVGAKSALSRGGMTIVVARGIEAGSDDARIYAALLAFIWRYRQAPEMFRSFAVLFDGAAPASEKSFESALWTRVQALSDQDGHLGQPYDSRVAEDPEDPHFSVSFGGEGFFIVGLHPAASRPARRFEVPVLVFNLHDQFERLRNEGRYERLRDSIVERDVAFAGSANPMLADHGARSAARQFSGRAVPEDWACPFQRRTQPAAWNGEEVIAALAKGAFVTDGVEG